MKVWVNGELLPAEAARVSVFDHGLTVGDGVFETCKVVDGKVFALTRHLQRLAHSARGLGLEEPDLDRVREGVQATLAAAEELPAGRVRITYTGGVAPMGSARAGAVPTLIVAAAPLRPRPPAEAVVTVPWPRNERAATVGLKTTSYVDNVVALEYARRRGATEAIFANTAGMLCEGTATNVFVVRDGRLLTPPLSAGCLAGVTRALVLEWTEADETDLPVSVLQEADEIFLTSSTRDVVPVHSVDGRPLATGPVTREAAKVFAERSAANLDP